MIFFHIAAYALFLWCIVRLWHRCTVLRVERDDMLRQRNLLLERVLPQTSPSEQDLRDAEMCLRRRMLDYVASEEARN